MSFRTHTGGHPQVANKNNEHYDFIVFLGKIPIQNIIMATNNVN